MKRQQFATDLHVYTTIAPRRYRRPNPATVRQNAVLGVAWTQHELWMYFEDSRYYRQRCIYEYFTRLNFQAKK